MRIRAETAADMKAIYRVHQQAFPTNAEADLVDLLRASSRSVISLVADIQGEAVGHILFSPVSLEPPAENWRALGLAPVGVIPIHQEQGIGKALIRAGIERCQEMGFELVFVLGKIDYYAKFGFQRASVSGFDNEYQVDEPFMVVELVPGTLGRLSGLVKYAPEFRQIGT
jgi:putative acetyltransferase